MIIRLLILLTFLVHLSFSADSINIALYSKPFLKYVGSQPPSTSDLTKPDTSKTNPKKLVDGNYFTFVEFPSAPSSNVGSYFGIEMPDSFAIERVRFVNVFNVVTTKTTIRKYQLFAANIDTSNWILIAEKLSNPDTTKSYLEIADFDETKKWKYLKLVLTAQDQIYSTVVSEMQVYISVGSAKTITLLSFSPPQYVNGESIHQINWQSVNLLPDDKVNIYYKLESEENYLPLALNEPNDGIYQWNTTLVRDAKYVIKVEPAVAEQKIGLTLSLSIENYTNAVFTMPGQFFQYGSDISKYYSSTFMEDSLILQWEFNSKIKKNFSYHLQYSIDSGKTWIAMATLDDSSQRRYAWKISEIQQTGMYTFFKVGIFINSTNVAKIVSTGPRILVGGWNFASVLWNKKSNNTNSSLGNIASIKKNDGNYDDIVFGPRWIVKGNGDTSSINFWNSNKYISSIAISDIDGNGTTEIISSSVTSENGVTMFADTLSTFGTDPVVVDMNNDGKKEIVYHKNRIFTVVSNEGKVIRIVSIPSLILGSYGVVSVVDLNDDGQKDYVFGQTENNSIYAFDQSGVGLSGYPIIISDIIQSSPLIADLFQTGEPNIIVAARNNIFCFDKTGKLISGFPYVVPNNVSPKTMSIADIDNDGYLDIVFTTTNAGIYCINRFAQTLNGWPIFIKDTFVHFQSDQFYFNPLHFYPVTIFGSLSSPYILSIDGDWKNEIIFFSKNGLMYVFDNIGNLKPGFPAFVGAYPNISAHFGDFDNNGTLNAIVPVAYQGVVYMMNMDFGSGSYNPSRMPWPTERQNVERTGIAPQAIPVNVKEEKSVIPERYSLSQNFPNPFNPTTSIQFALNVAGMTTLKVYDVLGREVTTLINENIEAGTYVKKFNATNLNSGLYFYTLRSGNFTETKKMMLLK